jgi:transposase
MQQAPNVNAHSKCNRRLALKNSMTRQSSERKRIRGVDDLTNGVDLGDKTSRYCVIDSNGEVVKEAGPATTRKAIREKFGELERSRIALEVGPHSPWVSRFVGRIGTG